MNSKGYTDNDCGGGDTGEAFDYIKDFKVGLASDTDYPYVSGLSGTEGTCKTTIR